MYVLQACSRNTAWPPESVRLIWNRAALVIEIAAAVLGASIGVAGVSAAGLGRRNMESHDTVIRLTVGVENIADKLEKLHRDIKDDRRDFYARLTEQEQRIAALEHREKPEG